ncbi:hypothetical protein Vqi01_25840 [Micromonospora qiuiae]|uniref:Uncharacterized protein n=1 Tax=Micromonospora qiuiae TaxID=502268 RepID=A0ABQ4JBF9_9ACTN|nr:hypothetical protein Vqi01_25840 [Micromonospora qiuiae]
MRVSGISVAPFKNWRRESAVSIEAPRKGEGCTLAETYYAALLDAAHKYLISADRADLGRPQHPRQRHHA